MIPSWWPSLVLVLAIYRMCRLAGWDDFPPVARARAWAVGAKFIPSANEPPGFWHFKRPLLHHFLGCAYCLGFWISVGAYLLWRFEPTICLYAAMPWALSGAVGLVAKVLDP